MFHARDDVPTYCSMQGKVSFLNVTFRKGKIGAD